MGDFCAMTGSDINDLLETICLNERTTLIIADQAGGFAVSGCGTRDGFDEFKLRRSQNGLGTEAWASKWAGCIVCQQVFSLIYGYFCDNRRKRSRDMRRQSGNKETAGWRENDGLDEFGGADLRGCGINGVWAAGGVLGTARRVLVDAAAATTRGSQAGAVCGADAVSDSSSARRRVGVLAGRLFFENDKRFGVAHSSCLRGRPVGFFHGSCCGAETRLSTHPSERIQSGVARLIAG